MGNKQTKVGQLRQT